MIAGLSSNWKAYFWVVHECANWEIYMLNVLLDSKKLMPMAWTHESTYFQIKTMKEIISVNNSSKLIVTINSVWYGQNSVDFICDLQNIWP